MRQKSCLFPIALWALCLLYAPHLASAETISIKAGLSTISMPLREGDCVLDRERYPDGTMIALLERMHASKNILVLSYADCTRLEVWRRNPQNLMEDYGQVFFPKKYERQRLTIGRRAYVRSVVQAMQGIEAIDDELSEVARKIEEAAPGIQMNELKSLGIIHVSDDVAILGTVQGMAGHDGASVLLNVGVTAFTLVKGTPLYLGRARIYQSEETIRDLLAEQKALIDALLAAN